jgi:hypothetical protein
MGLENNITLPKHRLYIVAYLDLLNQRKKIIDMDELDLANEVDQEKFKTLFDETCGTVKRFKESIVSSLNTFCNNFKEQSDSPVSKYFKEEAEFAKANLKFDSIGDTVIIFLPIQDSNGLYHPEIINQIFCTLSLCFLMHLVAGKVFRGGIEIGKGMEIETNKLYGPAIVKAYNLENDIAQYPRIVIGKDLIEHILNGAKHIEGDPQLTGKKLSYKSCFKQMLIDGDGNYILDYFRKDIFDFIIEKSQHYGLAMYQKAVDNVYAEINKFLEMQISKTNTNLYLRYRALSSYIERKALQNAQEESDQASKPQS